jgi:hypothetical protein
MAGGEDDERRPKRRCAARKLAVPSAAHYVGYVEDEETPEMIMRKFEELDRVVQAGKASRRPSPAPGPQDAAAAAGPSSREDVAAHGGPHGGDATAPGVPPGGPPCSGGPPGAAYLQGCATAAPAAPHADALQPGRQDADGGGGPADQAADQGQQDQGSEEDQALTEAQLEEIFMRTSVFDVRSAVQGGEGLHDGEQVRRGVEGVRIRG